MKVFCPSCGTPVEFRYDDSFVRVCSSCRSAIVRTDRGIETFGQIADLSPTRSGLALGDRGRYRGQAFAIAGRAQYAHPAGGRWEEWFVKLDDGRWAWLSEAQGVWAMTFERPPPSELPPWSAIAPGSKLGLGEPPVALTVGERNVGKAVAAEGEIPFELIFGAESRFVDLSDGSGRFATLDYGAPGEEVAPTLYLGRQVTLAELELAHRAAGSDRQRAIGGERLGCPSCGGSIELMLPGRSLSVACPYCASVLDCEGPLAILAAQEEREKVPSPIALGSRGEIDGVTYVITGHLRRQAYYDGITLSWDELLLHEPNAGYRWLVNVRGHWSFVSPLPAGAVQESSDGVYYGGRRFRLYDMARPRVIGVWGEFYWKVRVGEVVEARDYISPPAMLSYEGSDEEVSWSLGIYQTPAQIQRAFRLKQRLPAPLGVAGHQPFAHAHLGQMIALVGIAFLVCNLLLAMLADPHQVHAEEFYLGSTARGEHHVPPSPDDGGGYPTYVAFSGEFDLRERENTRIGLSLPVNNSWAYATIDLIHDATGEFRSFAREISYYHGVESGEAWTEGSQTLSEVLRAGRSGRHLLRLEVQSERPLVSLPLRVTVEQDVFPSGNFGWAMLLLLIPSALLGFYQWSFERRRWSESDYAPGVYQS